MKELDFESIRKRSVKGVIALTTRSLLLQIISLVAFSLLTYFLSPKTIGIFGVAMAATKFFTLFIDIGFGAALIQKKEAPDEDDLRTTFTIQEFLVGIVVILGLLVSRPIGSFFSLSDQGLILFRVLIIILFISSLKTIPSILMERRIQFEKQILPQIAESIVFNFLVVMLAVRGLEVSSFTWAFLISSLVSLPLYYILAPWHVGFGIKKEAAIKLLSFGTPYQIKSILGVVKDDLIKLYATKAVGLQAVGYLEWGQRWAFSPFRFLVDSITKVTFPTFSRIQEEREILRKTVENSLFAVSFVMFPVMAGMVLVADYFIQLIPKYQKWEPAVPILFFFCFNAAVSSLSNILVNVLDSTGRVKTTLILMVLWTVLTWTLTPIGIYFWGVTGVAAVSALITLTIIVTVYLVKRIFPFNFFSSVKNPLIITVAMLILCLIEKRTMGISLESMIFVIISGSIVYIVGMWAIAAKDIKGLISIIRTPHE